MTRSEKPLRPMAPSSLLRSSLIVTLVSVYTCSTPKNSKNEPKTFETCTGRSRGFGFVTYEEAEDAKKAVDGMTDQDLDGRTIRCDLAQDRGDRSSGGSRGSFGGNRSSSYGGGRSSYGGGRSDSRRDGGYGRSDRREGGYGGERRSHRDDRGSYDRGDRYDRE